MRRLIPLFLLLAALPALAHVGDRPSIHDTIAMLKERMLAEMTIDELIEMDGAAAAAFLNDHEREVLGSEWLSFDVDRPVMIYIMRDKDQRTAPFWLEEKGFQPSAWEVRTTRREFEVWYAPFDAGRIGLGISSVDGSGRSYFVGVAPQQAGPAPTISDTYPGHHWTADFTVGEQVYNDDRRELITEMPEELEGIQLVRGLDRRRREGQLLNIFRMTRFPAGPEPGHIVLTWHGEPSTTQAINWRTDTSVTSGSVEYRLAGGGTVNTAAASHTVMTDTELVNDPSVHRWTATLDGLTPDTEYEYRLSNGSSWTDWTPFKTAPGKEQSFSFIYMGDAQNGLDFWGDLLSDAFENRPDAHFYIMAGDLVNRGNERDDWDDFFHNAEGIYDRRQLVPAIGNHEDQGPDGPWMYLQQFELPENGPDTIPAQRAYSFEYSNALFVILDTMQSVPAQLEWLETTLANSDATWKFVVYHHPAYSSSATRDNPLVREVWGEVFDRYHVDLALQGHDHAYLRTYPMRGGEIQDSPAEGTIYIVSVAGTKYYDMGDFDYTEVGFTNRSTYQVLDITIDGNRLEYVSYDSDGEVADRFTIEK